MEKGTISRKVSWPICFAYGTFRTGLWPWIFARQLLLFLDSFILCPSPSDKRKDDDGGQVISFLSARNDLPVEKTFSFFLEKPLHHPGENGCTQVMEFQPIDIDRVAALRGCNKVCRNPKFRLCAITSFLLFFVFQISSMKRISGSKTSTMVLINRKHDGRGQDSFFYSRHPPAWTQRTQDHSRLPKLFGRKR